MTKPRMPSSRKRNSRLSLFLSALILSAIALLTLLAYGTSYYGWSLYPELLSHFQAQYFGASLLLLTILLLLRRKWFILVSCFLCASLSLPTLSWYLPPRISTAESHLRLLVANINTQNQRCDQVLALTRTEAPDVAIFLEVDDNWKAQLDQLNFLYSFGQTRSDNFGLLIYSQLPLEQTQIEFFGTDNIPSIITQLTIQGEPVTLLATHPLPPVRLQAFNSRNRQLDSIGQYLQQVNTPAILAGDLNTTMWSPYYRRLVNQTRLRNSREGFGLLPTWPTPEMYPAIPAWIVALFSIPIDHCLVSSGIEVVDTRTGPSNGSDHKPMVINLRVVGDRPTKAARPPSHAKTSPYSPGLVHPPAAAGHLPIPPS